MELNKGEDLARYGTCFGVALERQGGDEAPDVITVLVVFAPSTSTLDTPVDQGVDDAPLVLELISPSYDI